MDTMFMPLPLYMRLTVIIPCHSIPAFHHFVSPPPMPSPFKNLPPLETLIFFEAVGRNGSFTRAARELHLTQSAVSKQIRRLEEATALQMFERHARLVRPTAAGKAFLQDVAAILHGLQRSLQRIQRLQDERTVTVVCTQAVAHYWLFRRIVEFNRVHPEVTVKIASTNKIDTAQCVEHDFGILYGDGEWKELESVRLFDEVIYPVARADFPVPAIARPADLLTLPLIELDTSGWDCMNWEDWLASFSVAYRPMARTMIVDQLTLALDGAIQGIGIALGWDFMVRDLVETGVLKTVGASKLTSGKADFLVHSRSRPLSPASIKFRDWMAGHSRS